MDVDQEQPARAMTARRRGVSIGLTLAAVLAVAALSLSVRNGSFSRDPFILVSVGMIVAYAVVGGVLARRVPDNPIGWLFLYASLCLLLGGAGVEYATYALRTSPGSLPFGEVAAWLQNWSFVGVVAFPLVLALFPTGRVPSRSWRWLPPAVIATAACAAFAVMFQPGRIDVSPGVEPENPFAIDSLTKPLQTLAFFSGLCLLALSLVCLAALIWRYRHAEAEERQQVRWLAAISSFAGVCLVAVFVTSIGVQPGETRPLNDVAFFLFFASVGFGIPGAIAVALLKYHLYDLDLVIKKTVIYTVVAVLLVIVFLTVAVLAGGVVGQTQEAAVIAAALIGVASWPALRLARRLADRMVYGGRATPYEVLTTFGERMSETYSTDDVLPRTAQLLGSATGASRASVWILVGSELRLAACWPDGPTGERVPLDGDALPVLPANWAEEVRDRGELLGALAVDMPANDPIGPGRQRLIRDLAAQAGLAIRNVRLVEDLRASRRRIVAAQDDRAKKLERDIHDGAQQQLVALQVQLRLMDQMLERDPVKAKELLGGVQTRATEALEDLRDLARGIYPPLLAAEGLAAAIGAQARKAALPVTIDATTAERFSPDVEATVYFCTLEALTNAAKYAEASHVAVSLARRDGALTFSVNDDGLGFDPSAVAYGTGLQGIADRLAAVGGALQLDSVIGSGTTLTGRVPVDGAP
jgi:signal transduction histidine kinase